ncbi:MAG: tRNA pseudouridine(13) synthase TruD [Candidatus Thorarchaeota archaeon]|nr:tRNA pseudouridine(13) synthase TruD [Candidatus Thorarchaeota archaeon]
MKEGHSFERSLGMNYYSTDSIGIGGKLKTRYEDFLVEEIDKTQILHEFKDWQETPSTDYVIDGKKERFVTLTMQKMGLSTLDASTIVASALRLPRNLVTYAGLKDKRAVTVQRISLPSHTTSNLGSLNLSRIELRDLVYSRKPIQIGDLWGNRFTILLRDIAVDDATALEAAQRIRDSPLFNYFGIQRFGLTRPNTHLVGKALVKCNFEEAVRIMLCSIGEYDSDDLREAREKLTDDLTPTESIIETFPKDLSYERNVMEELLKHPTDFERAVLRIQPRILTLMVHAFQSYIFNRLLSRRAESGISIVYPTPGDFLIELDRAHSGRDSWLFVTDKSLEERINQVELREYGLALPVPGYSTRLPPSLQSDELKKFLKEDGVTLQEFRNSKIRALDSAGGLHLAAMIVDDLEASYIQEGLRVRFSLRKGSYATVVLRELMKNHPMNRI